MDIPEFSTQAQTARKQVLIEANKHSEHAKKMYNILRQHLHRAQYNRNSCLPNSLSTAGAFNAKKFVSEEHKKLRIFATNPLGSR